MEAIRDIFVRESLPFSIEIFPPRGELSVESLTETLDGLAQAAPDFISVTCSAGGSGNGSNTTEVAHLVQTHAGLPAMAHLTCVNSSRETIQQAIEDMRVCGIENVLALRGDIVEDGVPGDFAYAKELIPLLKDAGFCVGAAAYPEGHIDCLDLERDIEHMKEKQDAGADFFVTQLFFDNDDFYRFRERAARAGITAPITCGIMPLLGRTQIQRMVFMCGSSLPSMLIKLIAKHENDPDALRQAGIGYACEQIADLARHGVDGVHVYTMNHADIALAAARTLSDAGYRS